MNTRRDFFKNLVIGAAAFAILPSAETYQRIWKPKPIVPVRYEINPDWVNAQYELVQISCDLSGEAWSCYMDRMNKPWVDLSGGPFHAPEPPLRFTKADNGELVQVNRFIAV